MAMAYLHVYTGNGKGKTTCAVGLAVRALGAGMRVAFLQFDKGFDGENEHYNERHILRKLDGVDVFPFGLERMMPDGKFRFKNIEEDLGEAQMGLKKSNELVQAGEHDVLILDEIVTCIGTKLLNEDDVMGFVSAFKTNPQCELIMTGRGAWPSLIEAADLVTEMTLIKHYWYEHKLEARPGIDF